jgi:hypothetical protein
MFVRSVPFICIGMEFVFVNTAMYVRKTTRGSYSETQLLAVMSDAKLGRPFREVERAYKSV